MHKALLFFGVCVCVCKCKCSSVPFVFVLAKGIVAGSKLGPEHFQFTVGRFGPAVTHSAGRQADPVPTRFGSWLTIVYTRCALRKLPCDLVPNDDYNVKIAHTAASLNADSF